MHSKDRYGENPIAKNLNDFNDSKGMVTVGSCACPLCWTYYEILSLVDTFTVV